MWVLKRGDGEKGSIPVGCSWPQRLAAPGMEMHWDKVVPLKWRLSDLLLFNLCPPPVGFGGGTWGKPPSWMPKPPSPPQDGTGQGRPHLTHSYSKGSSSLLGKVPLETKRVPISWYSPLGWGHPQPHGWW